jgi:hypothetical protein
MIWLLNLYLYFMFLQNAPVYQQLVAGGMPCWVQTSTAHLPVGDEGIGGAAQPVCWYDPSNTNDGRLHVAATRGSVDTPIMRKGR